jgi:hypothetical protein
LREPETPNQLAVEGRDDLYAICNLMKAHISWPQPQNEWPVFVREYGGRANLLEEGALPSVAKMRYVVRIGVVIDADDNPTGCYQRIRELCDPLFPSLPRVLNGEGIIADNQQGKRLGVWIMPDNRSPGDLETFLRHLVPQEETAIWAHAVESVKDAKKLGASCPDTHLSKANIHTWLAWQDPPGRPFGTALTARILRPESPEAAAFVGWFRRLFEV